MITRSRPKILCKFWIFPLAVLVLFVQGCATTKSTSVDLLAYKDRTKSSINEDVTVTVAVPTIAEAQAIYGVELAAKQIQPVWLEIKNDSADTYWFLPSGIVRRLWKGLIFLTGNGSPTIDKRIRSGNTFQPI